MFTSIAVRALLLVHHQRRPWRRDLNLNMSDDRCIVCGYKAARPLTSPLTRCPSCRRPCHSKCSGRRKDSPCDLCRKNAPMPLKMEAAINTNKRHNEQTNKQNSTQVSTNSSTFASQRHTSVPSRTTSPHHESFFSSTPAVKRPALNDKKNARTFQLGPSIETDEPVGGRRSPAQPKAQQRRCCRCAGAQSCAKYQCSTG